MAQVSVVLCSMSLNLHSAVEHWSTRASSQTWHVTMGNYDISGSTMPVYVGKSGVADVTAVHGNKKGAIPPSLKKDIPILGPHFLPPGYIHAQKQDTPQITPGVVPTTFMIKYSQVPAHLHPHSPRE